MVNIRKKDDELKTLLWHLGNELFLCGDDATDIGRTKNALSIFNNQLKII